MATRAGEDGPERRCIVTGDSMPVEMLLRFVIGPEGAVVPDVARRLPGRGIWLSAARDVVETAARKNRFAKAARRKVTVPEALADQVEALLVRRVTELLGLANRSGLALCGYEKARAGLKDGQVALRLEASDGGRDSRAKLDAAAPDVPVVDALTAAEMGRAFGRDIAVHVALAPGRLTREIAAEAGRLAGFRKTA